MVLSIASVCVFCTHTISIILGIWTAYMGILYILEFGPHIWRFRTYIHMFRFLDLLMSFLGVFGLVMNLDLGLDQRICGGGAGSVTVLWFDTTYIY